MRVLLVDDAEDFVTYIRKRLRLRGIKVFTAYGGEEALDLLTKEPVDVAVLDVLMPGLDGVELLVEIKKRCPALEVIMLTGHGTVEAASEGLDKGAMEYLLKPCDFDLLLGAIHRAHEKARNGRKGKEGVP